MKFTTKVPEGTKPTEFTKYITKALIDHISNNKIKLFSFPCPEEVYLNGDTITFEAEIIESPKVTLGKYFGIPITKKHKEIPREDIEKAISFIRKVKEEESGKMADDEFAKSIGHYTYATFKSAFALEMMKEKDKLNRLDAIEQVKKYLLNTCKVNIPQNLLNQLTEANYQEEVRRWLSQGNKEDTIPKDGKQRVRKNTEEETKIRLILAEIIDREKITGENPYLTCIDKILFEAEWS